MTLLCPTYCTSFIHHCSCLAWQLLTTCSPILAQYVLPIMKSHAHCTLLYTLKVAVPHSYVCTFPCTSFLGAQLGIDYDPNSTSKQLASLHMHTPLHLYNRSCQAHGNTYFTNQHVFKTTPMLYSCQPNVLFCRSAVNGAYMSSSSQCPLPLRGWSLQCRPRGGTWSCPPLMLCLQGCLAPSSP